MTLYQCIICTFFTDSALKSLKHIWGNKPHDIIRQRTLRGKR